jgi:hypothetical protein
MSSNLDTAQKKFDKHFTEQEDKYGKAETVKEYKKRVKGRCEMKYNSNDLTVSFIVGFLIGISIMFINMYYE